MKLKSKSIHPKINILVVDDQPEARTVIMEFISGNFGVSLKEDICFIEASNGHEALHKMRNQEFDFVIIDKNMPIKNGKELIKNILALKMVTRNQILVMSGDLSKEDVFFFKNHGVSNIIAKPFDKDEFVKKMNILIENRNHYDTKAA